MGKPYQAELEGLGATTAEVLDFPIKPLMRAVEDASAHGLVIVASGGSQTAALYLADLHHARFGHPCRVVTPLVLRRDAGLSRGHVWLLSAGGRNRDILCAAEHAIHSGARSVTALIASRNTPLQAKLDTYGASRTFAYDLMAGSDGFLATNSLWSMCLLLERAYAPDPVCSVGQDAVAALNWAPDAVASIEAWEGTLVGLGDPDTLVGLQDLEMRVTEAALAPAWVSDLRNLGHGRHYWFEANRERARAVCLYTEPYADLAHRTLALLATVSPTHAIAVPGTGSAARLAAIAWSMHAALVLGRKQGRDPGRPGVPAFGKALYGLAYISQSAATDAAHPDELIGAKLGQPLDRIEPSTRSLWHGHLAAFKAALAGSEVRGVVADFDGTLIETASRYGPMPSRVVDQLVRLLDAGLPLGIATGRGDSCGKELRRSLPEALWSRVWVGYHNGATIQPLHVVEVPDCPTTPVAPEIVEVHRRLSTLVVGSADRGRLRCYPTQCSMTLLDGSTLEQAWTRARAVLDDLVCSGQAHVWMSSHSIDVVLGHVTKLSVVSAIAAEANCLPKNVLTVGDRGRWPGNDTQLLDHPLSLSSDECSALPDRCWNLAGPRRRQVAATYFHFARLAITGPGVARYREFDDE